MVTLRMAKRILALVLMGVLGGLMWDVQADAACDQSTVQAQINAATNGSTVLVTPANCSATWGTVTITGKYITLDGNSANITRTSANSINVTVNSAGLTRVTNFDFSSSTSAFAPNSMVEITNCTYSASSPNASFRIDHSTFTANFLIGPFVNCHGRGLIDHNVFTLSSGNEIIHVWGDPDAGWTDVVTPGSVDAVYIEDNTFNGQGGADKTASFYGARTIYRFNTFRSVEIDEHGTAGRVGARWWEIYNNNFDEQQEMDKCLQIRAGSGMAFNNTKTAAGNGCWLSYWEEDGGYPANYQVGRGKNQNLTPAYSWSNWTSTVTIIDGSIQSNRDYYGVTGSFNGTSGMGVGTIAARPATCTATVGYWATDEGEWWVAHAGADGRLYTCTSTNTWTLHYTPLIYPHPLQSGATNTNDLTPPTAPANLRVS